MPAFTYAALDANGRETTGVLDALTAADAADQLTRRGLIPLRTTPAADGTSARAVATMPKDGSRISLRPPDLVAFTRQLATLVQAALPLDQALRLVAAQNARNRAGPFAARVADAVSAGRPLSDAMAASASGIPAYMTALVKAGETRGTPGPALAELAASLERRVAVSARVRSALLYPAVLIGVALLAVAIVIGVLVPTLLPLFQDAGRSPPAALKAADTISRTLAAYWPVLLGLAALTLIGLRVLWRRPGVRAAIDGVALRLPVFGPLIANLQTAVLARTFGSLLAHGVPLVDAMRLASTVVGNQRYRQTMEVAAERVKEGRGIAAALEQDRVLDDMALRFIAIGEQSSKVPDMLLHLANAADAEATRRLDGALSLVSPLLTIVIGVMIGGLILSVMQAILSVNDLMVR